MRLGVGESVGQAQPLLAPAGQRTGPHCREQRLFRPAVRCRHGRELLHPRFSERRGIPSAAVQGRQPRSVFEAVHAADESRKRRSQGRRGPRRGWRDACRGPERQPRVCAHPLRTPHAKQKRRKRRRRNRKTRVPAGCRNDRRGVAVRVRIRSGAPDIGQGKGNRSKKRGKRTGFGRCHVRPLRPRAKPRRKRCSILAGWRSTPTTGNRRRDRQPGSGRKSEGP